MNRYAVSSLVGQGSFGCVYKAQRRDDEKVVAIKVISKRGRSNRELKNLRRECDIQARLKNPHVIEMIESFESKFDLFVVTEFALMDLHRYLSFNGAMAEEHARRVIGHLVSALYYLHSNRILHRDLKPQNVLLDKNMHAKLCDFGLARNMTLGTHVLTSIKGTPLYMAPELLAEQPYDHQADMWSLGCIAYESMAGQPPFCATSILHLVKLIKHEDVKWPSTLSSECRSFLQGLLEKDPGMRISWTQLLCHPFVEGKLYIAEVQAEAAQASPFINPKAAVKDHSRRGKQSSQKTADLNDVLAALNLGDMANENLSTSRDSINAIAPSDIEQLETDVEDNGHRVLVPFADVSFREMTTASPTSAAGGAAEGPLVNSQTCFVSGNSNMILNHLNDNFPVEVQISGAAPSGGGGAGAGGGARSVAAKLKAALNLRQSSRSKDLEKRKLSQNLENFSLRLGQSIDSEAHRKTTEMLTAQERKSRDKDQLKQSMHSTNEEKLSSDNTPPCLLPGWDSCDESQSPPIENDEWLAFLHRSIQELLDGEFDSLKQHNLVSIIVAPLRNSKAIPKVLQSVAQLLSLPFVLAEPLMLVDLDLIRNVYVDVKLVPNLMYACKLLLSHRQLSDSAASAPLTLGSLSRTMRSIPELSVEEMSTACSLYELVCHLVHQQQQFLSQFCDAVAILGVNDLFLNFLTHEFKHSDSDSSSVRLAGCMLALMSCVLRELPENAELVEKIAFNPRLRFATLLQSRHQLLRQRACQLLRLLARFSLRGVHCMWGADLRGALQALADQQLCPALRIESAQTLDELSQFSFFVA
ncbi:serine/threonine-protein kinase fused [Drosophila pseudoobscura]|uniref:non-specific serine/threonine protein kinase n=1 Tax=Drosophila pseudoobscura pseudoobscura TaxID=46245 RepID=A0A6I8UEW4_DROPS|nr:serine/threonine-protein kinase fused [Drosophila pseudoobscura]XP_033240119.1 serine/threonine-protein kinase fused [Drosophila pseudoobscura]